MHVLDYWPTAVRPAFRYLAQIWGRYRGTLGEYLTGLSINFVRELLERRGVLRLSVNKVPLMCVFYDVRYFYRVFWKITGCTSNQCINDGER